MLCIWNWWSWIRIWLLAGNTAPVSDISSRTTSSANCMLSEPAVHTCEGWSLNVFNCSIHYQLILLTRVLLDPSPSLWQWKSRFLLRVTLKTSAELQVVMVCITTASPAKPGPNRASPSASLHTLSSRHAMGCWSKPGQDCCFTQNCHCDASDPCFEGFPGKFIRKEAFSQRWTEAMSYIHTTADGEKQVVA